MLEQLLSMENSFQKNPLVNMEHQGGEHSISSQPNGGQPRSHLSNFVNLLNGFIEQEEAKPIPGEKGKGYLDQLALLSSLATNPLVKKKTEDNHLQAYLKPAENPLSTDWGLPVEDLQEGFYGDIGAVDIIGLMGSTPVVSNKGEGNDQHLQKHDNLPFLEQVTEHEPLDGPPSWENTQVEGAKQIQDTLAKMASGETQKTDGALGTKGLQDSEEPSTNPLIKNIKNSLSGDQVARENPTVVSAKKTAVSYLKEQGQARPDISVNTQLFNQGVQNKGELKVASNVIHQDSTQEISYPREETKETAEFLPNYKVGQDTTNQKLGDLASNGQGENIKIDAIKLEAAGVEPMNIDLKNGPEPRTAKAPETILQLPVKELPGQVLKQIKENLKSDPSTGSSEVTIRLKPDNLGKIILRLTTEGGNLSVKIVTESTLTKALVEQNLSQLRQSLQDQGIKSRSIDVEVGGGNFFQQNQQRSHSRYTGSPLNNKGKRDYTYSIQEIAPEQGPRRALGLSKIEYLA